MSQEQVVSFLVEDQTQGGLWPAGDKGIGTVLDLHYETGQVFGREGRYKTEKPQTCAIIMIQPQDGSDPHEEITSVGDAAAVVASQNRDFITPAPGTATTGINKGGNWGLAMAAAQTALGKDFVTTLMRSAKAGVVGKTFEFIRVPQPERQGVVRANIPGQAPKKDRKGSILLFNRIVEGGAAANVPAPAAGVPTSTAAPAAPAAGGVSDSEVGSLLIGLLAEKGEITVAQLPGLLMPKITSPDPKVKGDTLRRAMDQGFLQTQQGWKFGGGKLSL